jgi:hypothetical protein
MMMLLPIDYIQAMINKYILYGIITLLVGQAIIWFQTNGQFIWDSWKKYPWIVALLGYPVSYAMILGTKWFYQGFGGVIWPGRLIGFACGMLIFGFLTHYLMNETLTFKTILTIGLSTIIVLIQIFMK